MAVVADWSVAVWRTNYLGRVNECPGTFAIEIMVPLALASPTHMELPSWGDVPGGDSQGLA